MTPEQKIDLAIRTLDGLKLLHGEKLEGFPDKDKAMLATSIVDAYKEVVGVPPDVKCDRSLIQNTLTEPVSSFNTMDLIQHGASSGLLLSPKEIAEQLYDVNLDEVNIRDLNKLVVEKWRDKYEYTSKIRPCRNNKMCSYLYLSIDWDLVGQALFQLEVRANLEAISE
jgi:hypothetical protein